VTFNSGSKNGDLAPPTTLEKPFRLAKYFSTVAIVIIFGTCLILAAFMSRRAVEMIQERVVEDTVMIMDNLNYHMFNNFLKPIYEEGGDGRLSQPEAYDYLNSVIQNTIHGFDISRVAIYDATYGLLIYSSDSAEPVIPKQPDSVPGQPRLTPPNGQFVDPLSAYLEAVRRFFLQPSEESLRLGGGQVPRLWRPPGASGRAAYMNYLKERTVIVQEGGGFLIGSFFPRGQFTMRCFKALEDYFSTDMSGVLEITRDLTPEYKQIASMQYTALATAICASLSLTIMLRIVVARGEAIVNQRNAEKAALSERLNQAERLVNLGRMVATVSHEIRNPLGIINSSADFLAQGLKQTPKMARLAEAIVDESERLSSIVTDFLDFARPQVPVFELMILEELLEEIFVLLEVQMSRAGVELKAQLRNDPEPISADRALMHQALVNVLVNAIQAMPEGGLLTVKTETETLAEGTGYLVVTIIDTGEGLSKEAAQNLFTPFHTTKVKGSGLGLVLTRNIVESHGGRIDLTNVTDRVVDLTERPASSQAVGQTPSQVLGSAAEGSPASDLASESPNNNAAEEEDEEDSGLIVTLRLPLPGV
jgi:signal transduction histidine kinase